MQNSFVTLCSKLHYSSWLTWCTQHARLICTVCMLRIRSSCEGLMSVTQQIHCMRLKHLLLRHMYNLSLPNLRATLQVGLLCLKGNRQNAPTLYCAVPYVVACVDVSRTVLSGPFKHSWLNG